MAETIRRVDYFKVMVPNRAGQGVQVLEALRDAGVNLFAFAGFPRARQAQLDFIPEDTASFKKAAKKAGIKLGLTKKGFLIQGEDRVGAVADIMGRLAEAKINVTALDAVSAGEGRYGAILWVKPPDIKKAAKALGAA